MRQTLQFVLIAAGLAAAAPAQTAPDTLGVFTFSYFVNGTQSTVPLTPSGNNFIAFPDTNTARTSVITLNVASSSKSAYLLTNAAISGSGYSLKNAQASIPAAGTGQISLAFAPTGATPAPNPGSLQFQLVSDSGLAFNLFFNLTGTPLQPQIVVSYVDPATGNQLALNPGGTVTFGKAPVGQATTSQVILVNNGTGSGTVDSVLLTGSAFKLTGQPLLPYAVAAGRTFSTGISYSPVAIGEDTGTLTLSVGGVSSTYNLDGIGAAAAFSYSLSTAAGDIPVLPGGTVTLPATAADGVSPSSITLQVKNTGNSPGTISTIVAVGADFQIANPPVLPDTLKPGDSAVFNVIFQPTKAGASTGRLQVGGDLFTLTGSALGSALNLSIDVGAGPVSVRDKSIVSIPNTTVGDKRLIYVTVANSGNQSAIVSGIGVTGAGFNIPTLPALPATLAAGQTILLSLQYAPQTATTVTANVTINDQSLTLLGVGQPPPTVPAVAITNVPAALNPLQQPSAGVQLSAAYPYDLKGTLTLSFLSDSFVDDPSIQFATGGRSINFTIPANTTQAVFLQSGGAALGSLAPFQTGTVSGGVTLTVSGFTVAATDVTPAAPPSRSFPIAGGAPQLRSARVDSVSGTQIVLLVSGYSTPRNLSQLSLQFTGVPGAGFQNTTLNVDVGGAFTSWYSSSASAVFGSQFTVSLTVTVTGDPAAIQSIAVTATNSKGTSAAQTALLH